MYAFSSTSLSRLHTTNKHIQVLMKDVIRTCPVDFGIPYLGGIRTAEQQFSLYKKGRKKIMGRWIIINKSKVVTYDDGYKNKSYHQSGNAIDVVPYVNGKYVWDDYYMGIIAGAVLSSARRLHINITWGGTFGSKVLKGWDKGHYQI